MTGIAQPTTLQLSGGSKQWWIPSWRVGWQWGSRLRTTLPKFITIHWYSSSLPWLKRARRMRPGFSLAGPGPQREKISWRIIVGAPTVTNLSRHLHYTSSANCKVNSSMRHGQQLTELSGDVTAQFNLEATLQRQYLQLFHQENMTVLLSIVIKILLTGSTFVCNVDFQGFRFIFDKVKGNV